jgi:hypothetical protein
VRCPACAAENDDKSRFCVSCGAPLPEHREARSATVAADRAGYACPYCHSALVEGQPASLCTECSTLHHPDCWTENGGCAVAGCAGGPRKATPAAAPPAPAAPAPATTGAAAPPASVGSSAGRRTTLVAVVAACLLALAAAGIAVALVATRGDDEGGSPAPAAAAVTSTTSTTATTAADDRREREKADQARMARVGDPDGASDRQIESAIERTLKRHHIAINRGQWRVAYQTLSRAKRSQKRAEAAAQGLPDGVAKYRSQFRYELEGQILASSTTVRLVSVDPDTGEATIELSIPKRNGGCYSGTTWAVFENGGWRYDLGSTGHPDRPTSGSGVLQSRSTPC